MPEKWTGEIVGKMHTNCISVEELAKGLGLSKGYMSMILNSKRNPADIQPRIEAALDAIIKRKQQ